MLMPKSQILIYRQIEYIRPLKHHSDISAKKDQVGGRVENIFAVDGDIAFDPYILDQIVHPVKTSQQRRLTAARRPDDRRDIPVGYLYVDFLQGAENRRSTGLIPAFLFLQLNPS